MLISASVFCIYSKRNPHPPIGVCGFLYCLCACGAEAAAAALGLGQGIHHCEHGGQHRCDHKLRHSFSVADGLGAAAVVVEHHQQLSTVVAVDDTDLVGGGKIPLGSHAAAGVDKPRIAYGYLNGDSGGNGAGLAGLDGHRGFKARI